VRVSEDLAEDIEDLAYKKGFETVSDFIRHLFKQALKEAIRPLS
jgi:Arc/MetJ-type ribon-helix-helix transcriptional regulator